MVVPWDRQGYMNLTNTAYVVAFCRRYRLERPMCSRGPDKCACGWSSVGLGKCVFDGDHDECDCPRRSKQKTLVHHALVAALVRFVKDCGMVDVSAEYKYWDPARVGTDGTRRVPDLLCTNPHTQLNEYLRLCLVSLKSDQNGALNTKYTNKCCIYRRVDQPANKYTLA